MIRVGALMAVGLLCSCRPSIPPGSIYKAALAEFSSSGFLIKAKNKNECAILTKWRRVEHGLDRVQAKFICRWDGFDFNLRRQQWDSTAAKYVIVRRTPEDSQWMKVTIRRISKRLALRGKATFK